MKAVIEIKRSSKPGGANRIRDRIKSAFKQGNINALAKLDNTNHVVHVEGQIDKKRLDGILSHVDIPFDVEYEEENNSGEDKVNYPVDYFPIKQRVEDQRDQIRNQKAQISGLKRENEDQERIYGNEINTLNAKLKDAEARASSPSNIGDFVSETVARESKFWEGLAEFYRNTVASASEIYEIDSNTLEEEVLSHKPLEETEEFKRIQEEFDAAKKASEFAEQNPYTTINPEAEKILRKVEKMRNVDEGIAETTKDLRGHFEGKKTRVIMSNREGENSIIFPFQYKGEDISGYNSIEIPVLESVKESLDQTKASYAIANFEGAIKYELSDVPGTGKAVRNKVMKAISSCDDPFTILGGSREVVRIEVG